MKRLSYFVLGLIIALAGAVSAATTNIGALGDSQKIGYADAGFERGGAAVVKVTDGAGGYGTINPSILQVGNTNSQPPLVGSRDDGGGATALTLTIGGNGIFKANASGIFINDKILGFNGGFGGNQDVGLSAYSFSDRTIKIVGSTAASVRGLLGGGSAVASASAMPLPTGRSFHVTGTTNITSITSTNFEAGVVVTLIFDGALTFTDGNNLKLAGNFVTTADDTLTLAYDGTNWYEVSRAVN